MAVIRERRLPKGNLTLQLPIPEGAATAAPAAANDCCKGFSIPVFSRWRGQRPPCHPAASTASPTSKKLRSSAKATVARSTKSATAAPEPSTL
ncbi:hypothetical protein HPP92_010733 [Vanilla planifolia]|uniref:Uncharacterized protein n=1 Tax=Vanilla planifolia TaxID=51239 RepID=A0A835V0D4_VANPL|nr:hypothetical protein HPP92_010733 [Vanilla planifolia]